MANTRAWETSEGVITEDQLKAVEYSQQIADGYGYYKIKTIPKRGKDPVCRLVKIENHPHNPDDYGQKEWHIRLSDVFFRYQWALRLQEAFKARG